MSNAFDEFSASAFDDALDVFGDSISVHGKSISCVASSVTFDEELEAGGFMEKLGVQFTFPKLALYPKTVEEGDFVIYGGRRYKALSIMEDSISITLVCATDAK